MRIAIQRIAIQNASLKQLCTDRSTTATCFGMDYALCRCVHKALQGCKSSGRRKKLMVQARKYKKIRPKLTSERVPLTPATGSIEI